jgi:hypothetical protein
MNKKLIAATALTVLLALPLFTLAFNAGAIPTNANNNFNISDLLDTVFSIFWPVVVAVVIILFVVAGFLFLTAQGDPGKVAQARQAVIWGVVGVAVILLGFAIVAIVRNQLNAGGLGI